MQSCSSSSIPLIVKVIHDFIPSLTISVNWFKHQASLGNTLTPKQVKKQPSITIHDETNPDYCQTNNMTYVITLTDPDAPSRDDPKWSEMCHWIAAGVPLGKTVSMLPAPFIGMGKNSDLDEVMEYMAPSPPEKTGKHRYVFLVFAPSNGTTLPLDLSKPKDRQHWGTGEERQGVRAWAEENGLMPVGEYVQSCGWSCANSQ